MRRHCCTLGVAWLVFCAAGGTPARNSFDLPPHRTIFQTQSLYGTLEVTEAAGIRYLFVDGVLQTAMYVDRAKVARECHVFQKRYWLELLPYYRPGGNRCLLIGLGGGLLPAVLDGYGIETHAVEIDAKVVEVARDYFGYTGRATVRDGRIVLSKSTERYDFIVIDAFAGARLPFHLVSKECFVLVRDHLTSSGVLALNLIGKPTGSRVSASVVRTLREVFPHVAVYRTEPPDRVQSLICFASEKPLHLSLHPHGRELGVEPEQLKDLGKFDVAPASPNSVVLTDDHNPLETEWSKETAEWRRRMIELFGRY